MIDQYARQTQEELELHQLAIEANLVFWADALADVRRQTVDADTPGDDPFIEFAPRTEAGIGQRLVQRGRINEDGVVATLGVGRQRGAAARARSVRLGPWRSLWRAVGTSFAVLALWRALRAAAG